MILALASSLGAGNSILRSNLPDLNNAGSKISTRLVAAITYQQDNSVIISRNQTRGYYMDKLRRSLRKTRRSTQPATSDLYYKNIVRAK